MRGIIVFTTLCIFLLDAAGAEKRITYLVLAETVEPIMIVRDGDPMAGGLMTEIVELIFEDSDYVVEPMVLPWQRMVIEFSDRDDWVIHGIPGSLGSDIPHELSELPIFPFNHTSGTLKESNLSITSYSDMTDRTLILVDNFHYAGLDEYVASVASGDIDGNVGVIRSFTPSGSLEMLRHKRGDVVVDWQARIIHNLPKAGLTFEDVEFHDASEIVPTENVHLAFSPRHSDDFRQFVNDQIKALTESGQLSELVNKYYEPALPPAY
jgi:polar amino acid transport system substrate-binding protein